MPAFTAREYADMARAHTLCHGNSRAAAALYQQWFPAAHHPSYRTIGRVARRLRATGTALPRQRGPQAAGPDAVEEAVLAYFMVNPRASIRSAHRESGLPITSVWRILHRHGYHPYHVHCVQGLVDGDTQRRLDFCNWLLIQIDEIPDLLTNIIWTDEARFCRDGIVNRHNAHWWATENPRFTRETHHQFQWSTNVWCGIWGNRILGPIFYQGNLNGMRYLHLLRTDIEEILDNAPLAATRAAWYQHDGAPPHRIHAVCAWLDRTFDGRWIGFRGEVEWPARSPDLTPLDFFLWGYLKENVYATPPADLGDLRQRVTACIRTITPEMMEDVRESIVNRAEMCIAADGGHVEQAL